MDKKGGGRWAYRGSKFDGMRDIVHSMTRASLKEKNISAKPGSKEYEDEFNRLVQVYGRGRLAKEQGSGAGPGAAG